MEDLYQETRELSQRLQDSESELKSSDLQLKLKEEEKRKELEVMREHYQRKVEEAMKKGSVDSSVVEGYERQKTGWDQERQFLQEQLSFMQKQV